MPHPSIAMSICKACMQHVHVIIGMRQLHLRQSFPRQKLPWKNMSVCTAQCPLGTLQSAKYFISWDRVIQGEREGLERERESIIFHGSRFRGKGRGLTGKEKRIESTQQSHDSKGDCQTNQFQSSGLVGVK